MMPKGGFDPQMIISSYHNISGKVVLGAVGTYLVIAAIIIPEVRLIANLELFSLLLESIIFTLPYVGAIVGVIIALFFYWLFPSLILILEAITGMSGLIFQVYKLQSDISVDIWLGMLGSVFMAIHGIITIIKQLITNNINESNVETK